MESLTSNAGRLVSNIYIKTNCSLSLDVLKISTHFNTFITFFTAEELEQFSLLKYIEIVFKSIRTPSPYYVHSLHFISNS